MKKISGYLIAVPDKNNPKKVQHFYVTGPRFLYKDKIIKEFYDDGTECVVKENGSVKIQKENNHPKKTTNKPKKENRQPKKTTSKPKSLEQEDEEIRLQIAAGVERILKEKKSAQNKNVAKRPQSKKKKVKRKISKPKKKPEYFELRYTAPKERSIVARIINRIKYESGWYEDIEKYLYDERNDVFNDIEWSKNAVKRRDRSLYKRVQAYEDAEDDISMKKAFITVKVTAAAALLVTAGFAVNLLCNQVNDLMNGSFYSAPAKVKSTLANANEGQIEYARRLLAKIDYNFEYLSNDELLDTIIRVGSEPSNVTENRAMATIKKSSEFADQKLLASIVEEAYEEEYLGFDDNKKQELNQLVYEMLDEKAKIWIRSPEKVAQIATVDSMETEDMESGR